MTTSLAKSTAILLRLIPALIDIQMTMDIEFVQVLPLLYIVEMLIIAMVLITTTCHEAVVMVVGGNLVDIETLHPLMVEKG